MRFAAGLICASLLFCCAASAQEEAKAEVRLRLVAAHREKHRTEPAVIWLEPLAGTPAVPFVADHRYTLVQKNRMFMPHLQVIPVGSVVQFPNADPFFHNVFSRFDGKRFDLGLYEAGSSKAVSFPREGVSYIFCNIHPEMSAVVLTLSTPLFAIADADGAFVLRNVPPGDYKLNVWIEGVTQPRLNNLGRSVHVSSHPLDLGELDVSEAGNAATPHTDEYGHDYRPSSKAAY